MSSGSQLQPVGVGAVDDRAPPSSATRKNVRRVSSRKPPLSHLVLIAVLAVFAVAWFAGIEHRTLLNPDEGRYAEIPREMVVSGDWLTPRLNGLKYFEKPPLQYWATALAYEAFGVHNWTARLWPAVSTFAAALFLGYVGLRLGGPTMGLYSIAATLGCVGYAIDAHVLTLDAGLGAFLTLAFGAFLLAQSGASSVRERRNWMWVAWVAMAAATMSKGLIGIVIPGASLTLYTLVTRDAAVWRRIHLLSGLPIYLALAAPWFVAMSLANEDFAQFFFIGEHFGRYLTTVHKREHGWWYFVPVVVVGALPWLSALIWGASRLWNERRPSANGFSWQRFAIVWSVFVFAFFTVSQSKLPSYVLPMFPALTVLAASIMEHIPARTLRRQTLAGIVFVVACLVVVVLAYETLVRRFVKDVASLAPTLALAPWLTGLLLAAAMGSVLAYCLLLRAMPIRRTAAILTLSLTTLVACQLGFIGADEFRAVRSTRDLIAAAASFDGPLRSDAPFFSVKMFDQTLPLVLDRPATLVDYRDEFALGEAAEPARVFSTEASWIPAWEGLDRGYAMMSAREFEELAASGVPMRLIARDAARVIVSRR